MDTDGERRRVAETATKCAVFRKNRGKLGGRALDGRARPLPVRPRAVDAEEDAMWRGRPRARTCCAAAFVLAIALAGPVPPAHAAGGDHGRAVTAWSLQGLWTWLQSVMLPGDTVLCDCSMGIDPNGQCPAGAAWSPEPVPAPTIQCDSGMSIDPDGRCNVGI
jgi:hypothetical protein